VIHQDLISKVNPNKSAEKACLNRGENFDVPRGKKSGYIIESLADRETALPGAPKHDFNTQRV
jgi:hypothetical protein